MQSLPLHLLSVLCLCGFVRATQNPVGKVVELIKELQMKIQADGKAEQKIYDKFSCWCEASTARKATDIHQAMADIKSLSVTSLGNKGRVATRASEIAHLSKEVMENQRAQDTATAIRERENSGYQGMKVETEETLNSLERAIRTLMGSGTGGDLSLLTFLKAGESVHTAMNRLPVQHHLSSTDMEALLAFTRQPAASDYFDQKARKSASFSPQSATLQGILKDMYDSFTMNLEKSTETEATQQKNYESLMSVKSKEMASLTDIRRIKEENKAMTETDLAIALESLDDTTNQMHADTKFFDGAKASCTAKAAEWSERVRARSEELAGIAKGLEILDSDENRALFSKSIKPGMEASASFLQVSASNDEQDPQYKAYQALKIHATRANSLRLAALAARVRTSTRGHFEVVIAQVDKMITVLQREEKDDQEQRDWCKAETFKNEQEAARYQYKVDKHNAKVNRLTARLENLETTKVRTIGQIQQANDDMSNMETTRIAEHTAFQSSKADDEQATKVLESAIEVLGRFYSNNDIEMGKVQAGAKALIQSDEPEFAASEDQDPDAKFSDAGKSAGESKGIVSILTMLKEDLEDEVSNGAKNEAKSQKAFEAQMKAAKKLVEELSLKKTNLETDIASTNDQINEETVARDDAQGTLDEEKEYLASIKPDCDFMLNNFQKRRDARAEEADGLMTAKGMLAGAAPPVPLLLQRSDDSLTTLEFAGVSFLQRRA